MAPILRIVARIIGGMLIGAGYANEGTVDSIFSDPAFDMALGAIVIGATEFYYYLAKRYGWET